MDNNVLRMENFNMVLAISFHDTGKLTSTSNYSTNSEIDYFYVISGHDTPTMELTSNFDQ